LSWGTLWHLQKFLQYIIAEFIPSVFSLKTPPHSWDSFSRSHISIFIHEYIKLPPYSPPTPFPYSLTPPTGANPPTGPIYLPVLHFWKKNQFCLFKIAIQGVSLWHLFLDSQSSSSPVLSWHFSLAESHIGFFYSTTLSWKPQIQLLFEPF
jgi:hypothetical protein